jgi:hypothetical protein
VCVVVDIFSFWGCALCRHPRPLVYARSNDCLLIRLFFCDGGADKRIPCCCDLFPVILWSDIKTQRSRGRRRTLLRAKKKKWEIVREKKSFFKRDKKHIGAQQSRATFFFSFFLQCDYIRRPRKMERWRRTEGYIGYIDGWTERCWALSRVYITERGFPFSRLRFFYFLFCLIFIFLSLTGSSSRRRDVGGKRTAASKSWHKHIYRKKKDVIWFTLLPNGKCCSTRYLVDWVL